jgi:hypothetical protein
MSFTTNLLWQNDPRWADSPLGYGPQTIKQWGCLTTSLTMVVNGCGYNETPQSLSQKMVKIGAFNGAAINAYRLGETFPGVSLAQLKDCETPPAPLAAIDAELANNKPVLVRVDQSPAPDIQDHWVVLYAKDGNDYLMWDPYCYKGDAPGMRIHITDRYKNSGPTAGQAIVSYIFFNISGKPSAGTVTPTPAQVPISGSTTTTPVPANAIKLTPTADLLALRAIPDVTGALMQRFALGTTLVSLESQNDTQAKIGQYNQWIHVQAPDGTQGYVAAWYVQASAAPSPVPAAPVTPTPAPTPTTPPTPTPAPAPAAPLPATGFKVKATIDGTDFRKQPVVNASTLIARVLVGTTFTALDPNASTLIKDFNAWLKVKDSSGRVGYVAVRKVSV